MSLDFDNLLDIEDAALAVSLGMLDPQVIYMQMYMAFIAGGLTPNPDAIEEHARSVIRQAQDFNEKMDGEKV